MKTITATASFFGVISGQVWSRNRNSWRLLSRILQPRLFASEATISKCDGCSCHWPFYLCSAYGIGEYWLMSGCLSVCLLWNFYQIATPTVFVRFSRKLGTHNLCANTQKLWNTDLRNSDFKIFGEFFLNFTYGLSLCNSSSGAV